MATAARSVVAALCLLGVGLMAPAVGLAQTGTLNRFRAGETPEDDFHLSRPGDLGHLRLGVALHVDYGLDPLVYESMLGDPSSERLSVVGHQLTGTVGLAFGLFDRLVIFAGLPVTMVMDGASPEAVAPLGVPPADGPGLADAYLGARLRLLGDDSDAGSLGLQVTGTFPTSIDSRYRGEPFLTLHPELLGELRPFGAFRVVMNLGVLIREETAATASNLQYGHELTYGLGLAVPLWTADGEPTTHLDLTGQVYGATSFAMLELREGTALEATFGLKFFHASGVTAGLAAGPGLTRGIGSPDLRAIAMLGWAMPEERVEPEGDRDGDGIMDLSDECPDQPEDMDSFSDEDGCPDLDNDADGIVDTADACPNEPETVNDYEDADGCPDEVGDRDGDGLLDNVDECPDQAEDVDGFEDTNGCPDPDNDGDGVLDEADGCPLDAGPVENRGCPDSDRDGDTVVDRVDNCPDEVGTPENHGCAEEQRVVIHERGLEILEAVYFRTNRAGIQRRSHDLLLNVARVLNSHPEITIIQVEGHTDSRGRHERNMQLSQLRADAVVRFLVQRGHVSEDRLIGRGFGPDRPVVENATEDSDHARNRRVEFNIPQPGDPAR